jgi:Protein of unknown function (DUF3592)
MPALKRKRLRKGRTGELHPGCLSLFGLPFFAVGIFLTWLYFSGFASWWKSRTWIEVPCWIESTELKVSRGDDSDTYQALATYRYEYKGRTWHGDRVAFESGADNIGSFQQEAHRELKRHLAGEPKPEEIEAANQGPVFRCFIDPENPSEAVLYRTLRWELQAFKAIFALVFPAVGAGLFFGGLAATAMARRRKALQLEHPEEPWKWRNEWNAAAIPDSTSSWGIILHLYTLWSGLVIFPLLATTAMSGAFSNDKSSWLLMIFVALWCVPAGFSLRKLRARMVTGAVRFEPSSLPVVPGTRFEGSLVVEKTPPLRSSVEFTLECERRFTTHSGGESNTTREKIWTANHSVPSDAITREIGGFRIPVSFVLPADAPESHIDTTPSDGHVWRLHYKIPGTPVNSAFEIPVFHPGGKPATVAPADIADAPSIHEEISTELPARLAARRIQAEFSPEGQPLSIVCPPARNRSLLVFLVLFNLVWTAAAVFLVIQDAPLIFRIVWPVSAAGIWVSVFWSLLHKRTVVFSPDALNVRNQIGPATWGTHLEKNRITRFSQDVNMTSNNTQHHRVRAEDVQGRMTTLADGITETSTADALVKRLEEWRKTR